MINLMSFASILPYFCIRSKKYGKRQVSRTFNLYIVSDVGTKLRVRMRVTTKQIKDLIESEKRNGATKERIASLEQVLATRNSLKNVSSSATDAYMTEKVDDHGKKVVYYSTVPLSDKDRAYLDKL
jgi:hypothetical protein